MNKPIAKPPGEKLAGHAQQLETVLCPSRSLSGGRGNTVSRNHFDMWQLRSAIGLIRRFH